MTQPTVFISYSHEDEEEKEKLLAHLGVLENAGLIDLWSDDEIGAGTDKEDAIERAITQAKVAILLITANFLSSEFILEEQVSSLLKRREQEGLIVIPIIARASPWRAVPWLSQMSVRPRSEEPVWSDVGGHVDEDLAVIAEEIVEIIQSITDPGPDIEAEFPAQVLQETTQPETSSIPIFVGRERELQRLHSFLDQALTGQVQICFVMGEAGTGKSSLVQEFTRHVQNTNPELVVAFGECNAQIGFSDLYLPFKDLLSQLTGDVDTKVAQGVMTSQNASRLRSFLNSSGKVLVDFGPDLIDIFVPGAGIATRAAALISDKAGWLDRLKKRQQNSASGAIQLEQGQIFAQYTQVLQRLAKDQSLILILEDLHWVDNASVNLLFHLVRQLKQSRILFIGTYRPNEITLGRNGNRHPLESTLNEIKRDKGDVWVDLDQARQDEGQAFIDSYIDTEPNQLETDFREALLKHTDGHPLFTKELLRTMQERGDLIQNEEGYWIVESTLDWQVLPDRVEGVIEERINRLTGDLRDLLTVASVEGQDFTAQILAQVQEVQDRELLQKLSKELDKRHRLVQEGGQIKVGQHWLFGYRFSHALFQQYLYNNLSAGERIILHGEIAEILEGLYQGRTDEIAVRLARHYEEAGEIEKAVKYLAKAGEQAFQISANREAVTFFQKALSLIASLEEDGSSEMMRQKSSLLGKLGEVHFHLSDYSTAKRYLDESLALAIKIDDQQGKANTLRWLGITSNALGNRQEYKQYSQESLAIFREIDDRYGIAGVLRDLAVGANEEGIYEEAKEYIEESLKISQEIEDQRGISDSLGGLARVAKHMGNYVEAEKYLQQSLEIRREMGYRRGIAITLGNLGAIARISGRHSEARKYYEESLQISEEIENKAGVAMPLIGLGRIATDEGLYEEAKQHFEESLKIWQAVSMGRGIANSLANLGHVSINLEKYQDARQYFYEALDNAVETQAIDISLNVLVGVAKLWIAEDKLLEDINSNKEDAKKRTVELLNFILHYPPTLQEFRDEVRPLLDQLKDRLPLEAMETAQAQGQANNIETVVSDILDSLAQQLDMNQPPNV